MNGLARILFHMNSGQTKCFRALTRIDNYGSSVANGGFVLGNLVALGQVRVEVVFAGVFIVFANSAAQGQSQSGSRSNHAPVRLGEGAGQTQRNRTNLGIGGLSIAVGFGAIGFAEGAQLHVHL